MAETELMVSDLVEFKATHLHVRRSLSWDEGETLAGMLRTIHGAIQWWVGDFLNYAEREWGENYAQLFSEWEPQTLANWKYVAGHVDVSLRREPQKLSWSHHNQVASLPPDKQAIMLSEAELQGWSVRQLRRTIHGSPEAKEPVLITCPYCGRTFNK